MADAPRETREPDEGQRRCWQPGPGALEAEGSTLRLDQGQRTEPGTMTCHGVRGGHPDRAAAWLNERLLPSLQHHQEKLLTAQSKSP